MQPSRGSASIQGGIKLGAKLGVVANLFRLRDGEAGSKGSLLHRRRGELLGAAYRAVGLRDDQGDLVASCEKSLQRGHGEGGSAAEY
jgi:hypothetical protein